MEPTQTGLAIPLDTGFLSCHRCVKYVISGSFRKRYYTYRVRYLGFRPLRPRHLELAQRKTFAAQIPSPMNT